MSFLNIYEHSVDAKGRVSLPSKFRKELPDKVIVVPGFKGALYVYEESEFEKWYNSFFEKYSSDGKSYSNYDPRKWEDIKLATQLAASAETVNIDSVGRITLSDRNRKYSKINKDVVIVGAKDYIQIWEPKTYEKEISSTPSLDEFLVD
ncbi:MAG: hypothetical protein MJ189_01620 [Coriobacteriales bacterium]|nr:hypothetical protein [Coriobacteriales bacterium]